jgi:inhibitor of cysteine peptidase
MKLTKLTIICISLLSLLLLSACTQLTIDNERDIKPSQDLTGTYIEFNIEPDKIPDTLTFKNENELSDFIRIYSSGLNNYGMYNVGRGVMMDVMMESAPMMADSAVASKEIPSPQDYSTTNVQVEGVDEADILKTDGNYIYTISKNILYVIKSYPGEEAEITSTIKFDNTPSSLFINQDTLAVFGNFYDNNYWNKIDFIPNSGMSFFKIYDISDKTSPKLIEDYKFEGRYFNARMKGNYVYFITSSTPEIRPRPLPIIIENDNVRSIAIDDIFYYDIDYIDPNYINVHAINIVSSDKEITSKSIIVERSQNMYMSHNNIYMTYTEYINEYDIQKKVTKTLLDVQLTTPEKELIERIKITDNDILSRFEKENKIWEVYLKHISRLNKSEQDKIQDQIEKLVKEELDKYDYFEFTIVHRINIDKDKITPEANGKIPGRILNQFSMDEHDNIFRIATTLSQRWSSFKTISESSNNIFTLNMNLDIMDSMKDIAKGERIYSTRFIGDRLYMVTFREIDPFFVVDLSNPREIKMLGELKIPGFSTYLHPYDKDTIVGIGQEATETGRIAGLKVSLFDVSDVSNPIETAKYVTDEKYAHSTALYEHKAFLFSKEKELLVIPVYSYGYWYDESESYNGAFVFNIKKDSINLRGLIDHSSGSEYSWQPAVERSLYIEDLLYTKSSKLLRINRIDDLSSVKNIELNEPSGKIPIY